MGEPRRECKRKYPTIKNQHRIFQKELSLKVEEFRLARSKWLASKKEDEILTAIRDEGLKEAKVYKGRCVCLRKIGLKTDRLREHYQTLKPLRYFTLKQNLSDTNWSKRKHETKKQPGVWDQYYAEQESLEEQLEDEYKLRKKKEELWEEKEREIKELLSDTTKKSVKGDKKKKKRKGPSEKALENLRAAKQANRLMDTCKCSDGKEVTVVIKGFCLCDKENLKKFKLNKISDDYNKLEKPKPEPEKEEKEVHVVDSIEFRKKQFSHELNKQGKEEKEKEHVELQLTKIKKAVSFRPFEDNEEKNNEKKSEENAHKRDLEEKKEEQEKERRRKELEERKKVQEAEERNQEKRTQDGHERSKNQEKERGLKEEEKKKESGKEVRDSASVVTLFQNRSPEKSEMALTQDQYEKMKFTKE